MTMFLTCVASSFARDGRDPDDFNFSKTWNISFQAGPNYQIYENYFAYHRNREGGDLFNIQKTLNIGYDFTSSFGLRTSLNYGNNSAAYNIENTTGHDFRPYSFRSLDVFLDAILNINGLGDDYGHGCNKVFAGVGFGNTFGFEDVTDNPHPWQKYHTHNFALAIRVGYIWEYDFTSEAGMYLELGGTGFADNYNGLEPGEFDHYGEGYAGFPLDLKLSASFGFIYHF